MFNDDKKVIGIIGAMKSEIEALKLKLTDAKSVTYSGIEYVYGDMYGKHVVAAQCGIGKVFAAVCAQTMILKFNTEKLINIGVGGSLTSGLDIADVAIAESVVQHDMDTSAIGDPVGLISGINVVNIYSDKAIVDGIEASAKKLGINYRRGVIASGDCFVASKERKQKIVDNFDAIVCEMEGAAIGHVCYINQVPFCVLRAISDNGDENADNDYMVSMEKASKVALRLIDDYIRDEEK